MRKSTRDRVTCPNQACSLHGRRGRGNIAPHGFAKTRCGFQLLLFIPININDRHARAYQRLREKAAADYLTDIRVQESWTYALVGTVYTVRMDATAYPRN